MKSKTLRGIALRDRTAAERKMPLTLPPQAESFASETLFHSII